MAVFWGAQNRGFSDLQCIAAECCLWQSTSCCQRHTCRCSQPPASDKPHKAAHALPVQRRLLQTLWPGSCPMHSETVTYSSTTTGDNEYKRHPAQSVSSWQHEAVVPPAHCGSASGATHCHHAEQGCTNSALSLQQIGFFYF